MTYEPPQTIDPLKHDPWIPFSPLLLIGLLVEWPLVWLAGKAREARHALATTGLILLVLMGSIKPVRADFMGFDLVPLAGSLLMDIRDFYLTYQKQIMAIKRVAGAYYAVRQLDVGALMDDLGHLAELELTEAARAYVHREVEGYVMALTWRGDEQLGSSLQTAHHDGTMERGVRFRITSNDGVSQYMTAPEVWNALFNPYDRQWDPRLTHETRFVLRAHQRWLEREVGRYRRAVHTWEKLRAVHDGFYLEGIGRVSASDAVAWAIKSTVEVDGDAARLQSLANGAIQQYVASRLAYWKTRIAEVEETIKALAQAGATMERDIRWMERRALAKAEAQTILKIRANWHYTLPGDPDAPGKSRIKGLLRGGGRS